MDARRILRTRADRFLEGTLLASLLIHGAALLTMAGILLPSMPGPGLPTPALRLAHLAAHPWLWHAAWIPWHLSALSDIALSAAFLRVRFIPRRASLPTLALTLVAFAIEQRWEVPWNLHAPGFATNSFAANSLATNNLTGPAAYAVFEHHAFLGVTCIAASLYALMAMGWSWCVSFSPGWNRWLTGVSVIAWPALLLASSAPLLPAARQPPVAVITAGNQLGFTLLMLWYVLALEAVLRRTRRDEPWGGMAAWRAPGRDLLQRAQGMLANSRLLRYVLEFVPALALASDIRDVVYISYLVEASRLTHLLPAGLELQLLGAGKKYAMLTVLTYRHGAFGPTALQGLRQRLMPSPLQSNWRLYVREPVSGTDGVYFLATAMDHPWMALVGRLIAYSVPMHRPSAMTLTADASAAVSLQIVSGTGSAPDLAATLGPASPEHATAPWPQTAAWPIPWIECFPSFADFLAYCVPQERALSERAWDGRITSQEISLNVRDPAQRLTGSVRSATLDALCGPGEPVSFLLPRVDFLLHGEQVVQPSRPA